MMYRNKPQFIIKKNLQKSGVTGAFFSDVLTQNILKDVCQKITGISDFDCTFVDNDYEDEFLERSYNKGRMAILQFHNEVSYISFSESEIGGRNSSIQSVPTAYNMYYLNTYPQKRLYYYFLNTSGNVETDYQIFIYRLMNTIGFVFLNASRTLSTQISAFTSIEDIIFNRRINAGRNKSNNSTFITKSKADEIEVYGKTYGANKYETSLICYALATLKSEDQQITLYEIVEKNLKQLPATSRKVIGHMGINTIFPTDMTLEKHMFEQNNSLRSPRYLYNLFNKLGNKHCVLCNCEIPELIQGAHIWPVADIKRTYGLTQKQKLDYAIDGENGLWLCENHHKMFDEHLLTFNENGDVLFKSGIDKRHMLFINETTKNKRLPEFVMTNKFLEYLWRRNQAV